MNICLGLAIRAPLAVLFNKSKGFILMSIDSNPEIIFKFCKAVSSSCCNTSFTSCLYTSSKAIKSSITPLAKNASFFTIDGIKSHSGLLRCLKVPP